MFALIGDYVTRAVGLPYLAAFLLERMIYMAAEYSYQLAQVIDADENIAFFNGEHILWGRVIGMAVRPGGKEHFYACVFARNLARKIIWRSSPTTLSKVDYFATKFRILPAL